MIKSLRIEIVLFCLVLIQIAATGVAFARPVHKIPFAVQLEKADLVVIAHPTSATDYKPGATPRPDGSVDVITPFKVEGVIKGDSSIRRFRLLHHQYSNPADRITVVDGAGYIRFAKNDERPCLMFLKKAEGDVYVPYSGQYDPNVSIRLMVSPAPLDPANNAAIGPAAPADDANANRDRRLWHGNRITPEQPFPARVIGVIPSWVGYALLLEEIADETPRYCVAYIRATQQLEYEIVASKDAFKDVPDSAKATYLTPGVEVDSFSWSIGVWTIGRRFGEQDLVTQSYQGWFKRVKQPAGDADRRSGDLNALRAALVRGEDLADLHKKFQLGTFLTGYYVESHGKVGGRPASQMTFFRDISGKYYRVFSPKEIVLIDEPLYWFPHAVDAGRPLTR